MKKTPKQLTKKDVNLVWSKGTGNKKYKVVLYDKKSKQKIKTIQFGDVRYQHYKDKTPLKLYKHKDHNDAKRRKLYRQRHEKDRHNTLSAGWFADKYLW